MVVVVVVVVVLVAPGPFPVGGEDCKGEEGGGGDGEEEGEQVEPVQTLGQRKLLYLIFETAKKCIYIGSRC